MKQEHNIKKRLMRGMWVRVIVFALVVECASFGFGAGKVNIPCFSTQSVAQAATKAEKKAIARAKDLLVDYPTSKSDLIKQLKFLYGYSSKVAKYAAAHCGANWNNQAVERAKKILEDTPSFTKKKLLNGLLDYGFTKKQAKYGVEMVWIG